MSNDIRNRAYVYALLTAFGEEGGDYLDAFWPFALRVFPSKGRISCYSIRQELESKFDLRTPINAIQLIVQRARRKGFAEWGQRRGTFCLTLSGREYLDALETDRDVDRRVNAILTDMRLFLEQHGTSHTNEEVRDLLLAFIDRHNTDLISLASPGTSVIPRESPYSKEERLFVTYLKEVETRAPEHYTTVRDILLGSVIQRIFALESLLDPLNPSSTTLKKCTVYLDTSYLVDVLQLGFSESTEPALELFALLRAEGTTIRVFSFTVDELARLLVDYIRYRNSYVPSIRVQDIFSSLRIKGWSVSKTREYIANLERSIEKLGIEIEAMPDVDLDSYEPENPAVRDAVIRHKPQQARPNMNHDVAAIETIRRSRSRRPTRLADTKAIFLSSDAKLSRASYEDLGHKDSGTVSEVIHDRLLTSVLWLKAPSIKPSLSTVIASLSRDLFVKRRVWQRFIEVLASLEEAEEVDTSVVATLFYHGFLQGALETIREEEADLLDRQMVIKLIEKAEHESRVRQQQLDTRQRKEFEEELNAALARKEEEIDERWARRLEEPKRRIRNRCRKHAGFCLIALETTIGFGVLALAFLLWKLLQTTPMGDLYVLLATVAFGLLALSPVPWFVHSKHGRLKTSVTNRLYRRELRRIPIPPGRDPGDRAQVQTLDQES